MNHLILCNICVSELDEDEIAGVWLAKYGPQGADEMDMKVLACCNWEDRMRPAEKFVCDECGQEVAVAPSSAWFIEQHRQERAR